MSSWQLWNIHNNMNIYIHLIINNMNIEHLKDTLYQSVLQGKLNLDSTIVSNARHYDALQKAYATLMEVQQGIENDISSEFLAIDIKATAEHIGLITGEITNDELLGNIFSQFCIGK